MKWLLCLVLILCLTQDITAGRLKALLKEKHSKADSKYESSCKSYEDDACDYETTYGCGPRSNTKYCDENKNKKFGPGDKNIHHYQNPTENEYDCIPKHPCYDYASTTQYPRYDYGAQYPTYNYDYAAQYPSPNYNYAAQYPSPNYNYAAQIPSTSYNYASQNPSYNCASPCPSPNYNYAAQYPVNNYDSQNSYSYVTQTSPSCCPTTTQLPSYNTQAVPNSPSGGQTRCVCTTRCECTIVPQDYPEETTRIIIRQRD